MDLIAKEFHYHRSCYRNLTSKTSTRINKNGDDVIREECFEDIVSYVQYYVINEGHVIKITDLTNLYKNMQMDKNIPVSGVENRFLKARLVNRFKEKLEFFQKKNGVTEILYSDLPPTKEKHLTTHIEKVHNAASEVRKEILQCRSPFSSWPPPAHEVRQSRAVIPELLEVLLKGLFSDGSNSGRVKRKVNSIGQDIMFAATNGKLKTVKHIQLGIVLKRKTGSKDMIRCLNRLGHCLSYCELLRIETYVAETESNRQYQLYIPNNVQPSQFVTFVFDNCDHNPESLKGLSMHCTNGIIIQRVSNINQVTNAETNIVVPAETRRRSFQPIHSEITPYYQPKDRPAPPLLPDVEIDKNILGNMMSKTADLIWMLARYQSVQLLQSQEVPSWTGFYQEVTNQNDHPPNLISFLPAINQSPTQFSTVQEVLMKTKKKMNLLGLPSTDVVFDHAINTKALEVLNNPVNEEMRSVINLRMGGFHACCILLAVIGKRFGSAGLRDILVETVLVGPGTVESMLRGKHYNHGMRVVKTIYEALLRLKFESFQEWMEIRGNWEELSNFMNSGQLRNLIESRIRENMEATSEIFTVINQYYCEFEEEIHNNTFVPTARFWQSYIDIVQALLDYVKSFRLGDWDLQLSSMERLLIWFHAYDRINYARHFTYCWASLTNLHESHPTIYEEFKCGNFTVKRSPGNFNMIPPDQVIEQTVNREQKGAGGIIGSTTSTGCVQRWILSSHVAAAWCADFKESIGFKRVESGSKDLRCARKKFDEKSVQACYQTIEQWNNPFQPQENLIVLSSGVVASEEVQKDLLQAKEVGQTRLNQFLNERIIEGNVEFNATITKNALRTFDSSTQKKRCKVKDTTVAIKSDRETFGRLLIIQQVRGIDLEEVLQYELSPLPLSISNPDG